VTERATLESVYRSARYVVDVGCAPASFDIGKRIPQLARQPFALITAYNPADARPTDDENERNNERLLARIERSRIAWLPARGMSRDEAHVEPSFALFGISREDALALARDFGQAAIIWFDGKTAELAWTETPGTVADA